MIVFFNFFYCRIGSPEGAEHLLTQVYAYNLVTEKDAKAPEIRNPPLFFCSQQYLLLSRAGAQTPCQSEQVLILMSLTTGSGDLMILGGGYVFNYGFRRHDDLGGGPFTNLINEDSLQPPTPADRKSQVKFSFFRSKNLFY